MSSTTLKQAFALLGGVLCGLGPFLVGYAAGWRPDFISRYPWPLLLLPVGIPVMVSWFSFVMRVRLVQPNAAMGFVNEEESFFDFSRGVTYFFSLLCFFVVPVLIFTTLLDGKYAIFGIIIGIAVGFLASQTFLRLLQSLDWIDKINPSFDSPEDQERHEQAPIRSFIEAPLIAGAGTLIVIYLLAWPDYQIILAGTDEPYYRWGYLAGRLIIAFGIGAILASFIGRKWISYLWRLNIFALIVGAVGLLIIWRNAG